MQSIYLDHAATTPVRPEVSAVVLETMNSIVGNPSSIHRFGRHARKVVDDARKVIAKALMADPSEIIFTSGGTEANNMALFGCVRQLPSKGKHIITTAIEHHAVLHTCQALEQQGYRVTYLPVDQNGQIQPSQVKEALTEETVLVSIMYGNNEVGSIQPIVEIGELLRDHPAVFHTDAVQAFGIEPLNVQTLGVDLLSASAHKLNGPKGIGILYLRQGTPFTPFHYGGSQERKRRAGTENVPAIVGFAKAVELSIETREKDRERYHRYTALMQEVWESEGIVFEMNAKDCNTLPHIMSVSFPKTEIESLLVNLDLEGVAVSSGSACTAGSLEPSHVLAAMFSSDSSKLYNSVRFSFGYGLNEEMVVEAAQRTATVIQRLVN